METSKLEIKKVSREVCKDWILNKHYMQRMPGISYAYGLYDGEECLGVLTIGKPASNSLCIGICGKEYSKHVYELNRLITKDNLEKNVLSYFVSHVLKDLKKENLILVSYADEGAGHCGYIYQATNWIYLGRTKEKLDYYTPMGKHGRDYKKYGDQYKHLRKVRTAKHRYVYFCCDKKTKKEYLKHLNYPIEEYPKLENTNYELGTRIKDRVVNRETGETYLE